MDQEKNEKSDIIAKAVNMINNGHSYRKTASLLNVPKTSLVRWIKNPLLKSRPGPAPLLTPDEEKDIVQWIIQMEECGCPRSKRDVLIQVISFRKKASHSSDYEILFAL